MQTNSYLQAQGQAFDNSAKPERAPTVMSDIISRASHISSYSETVASRLDSLVLRLIGPEPQAINAASAGQSAPTVDPQNHVGKIEVHHSAAYGNLDRLSRALDRLENVI